MCAGMEIPGGWSPMRKFRQVELPKTTADPSLRFRMTAHWEETECSRWDRGWMVANSEVSSSPDRFGRANSRSFPIGGHSPVTSQI
jgi:hypothetical protein